MEEDVGVENVFIDDVKPTQNDGGDNLTPYRISAIFPLRHSLDPAYRQECSRHCDCRLGEAGIGGRGMVRACVWRH